MPDKRSHRGPHPQDRELFAPPTWPPLRAATDELCWLLSRGYAANAALKLVGDRHQLAARQRIAVARCSCSDQARAARLAKQVAAAQIAGRTLLLEGYNVLTTIEAALAGGVILLARDGCCRDLASMHGSYRKVEETLPALRLAGEYLARLQCGPCQWLLDSPVSNSGRLKGIILQLAADHGWHWQVELINNPDVPLSSTSELIATADSVILDRCHHWFNLAREIVEASVPSACVADLS